MSNSEGSSDRVPIFGRRKRLKVPLFADSIDTRIGLDDEDDLLFGDVNDGKRQIVQGGAQGQREMVGCNVGASNSFQSGSMIYDEGSGTCDGRSSVNSNQCKMDNRSSMNNSGTSELSLNHGGNVQCSSSKCIDDNENFFESNNYKENMSVNVKDKFGYSFGGESETASSHCGVMGQENDGVIRTQFEKSFEKQVKVYAKMVTTAVSGLERWRTFKDEKPIIFEVHGNLSSSIEYRSTSFEEVFAINDGVGGDDVQCVFWPIDRRLPQVLVGYKVRVVGFLKDQYFQVLKMREVLSDEMELLTLMSKRSEEMMESVTRDEFLMHFNNS